MRAEDLLAGPRGRRLCLDYLLRSDTGASWQLHNLINALQPGNVASFGWGDPPPSNVRTPQQAARFLAGVALRDLDEQFVLELLRGSVDAARYWQEPDGEDHLAADPALIEVLSRAAEQVLASEHTDWWDTPMDAGTQHRVDLYIDDGKDEDPGAAWRLEPAEAIERWWLEHLRDTDQMSRWYAGERDDDTQSGWRHMPVPDSDPGNVSGTWWSTPPGPHTTRSLGRFGPAGLHLVEDHFSWPRATTTPVQGGGRIYEIAHPQDWMDLCREHPLDVAASRRGDWGRVTGLRSEWVQPDWSSVAQSHDGVHLSVAAYLTGATQAIKVDAEHHSVIGGWGPDATYWLTSVPEATGAPQEWRSDDDRWWLPAQ